MPFFHLLFAETEFHLPLLPYPCLMILFLSECLIRDRCTQTEETGPLRTHPVAGAGHCTTHHEIRFDKVKVGNVYSMFGKLRKLYKSVFVANYVTIYQIPVTIKSIHLCTVLCLILVVSNDVIGFHPPKNYHNVPIILLK